MLTKLIVMLTGGSFVESVRAAIYLHGDAALLRAPLPLRCECGETTPRSASRSAPINEREGAPLHGAFRRPRSSSREGWLPAGIRLSRRRRLGFDARPIARCHLADWIDDALLRKACPDHQHRARAGSRPDEDMRSPRRGVEEIPVPKPPLLVARDEH